MTESWGRALFRASGLALWIFALGVVAVSSAYTWSRWRSMVAHCEADLDPRPRVDEMFPDVHEDGPARAARAASDLKAFNREYGIDLGLWAAVGAGLIAAPFVYRRRVPPEARPTRRAWLLTVPIVVVLVFGALLYLAAGLGGALRG